MTSYYFYLCVTCFILLYSTLEEVKETVRSALEKYKEGMLVEKEEAKKDMQSKMLLRGEEAEKEFHQISGISVQDSTKAVKVCWLLLFFYFTFNLYCSWCYLQSILSMMSV